MSIIIINKQTRENGNQALCRHYNRYLHQQHSHQNNGQSYNNSDQNQPIPVRISIRKRTRNVGVKHSLKRNNYIMLQKFMNNRKIEIATTQEIMRIFVQNRGEETKSGGSDFTIRESFSECRK